VYRAANLEEAADKAEKLIEFGGMGHTAVLYTAPSNKEHIKYYESKMETARVLINTPSSQVAIGDLYNFRIDPSLTLGCGTWGGTKSGL
jgi:acetaldehyde dehydrogenase / alcohol dehydrogenase